MSIGSFANLLAETFGVPMDDPRVTQFMAAVDPNYLRDKKIYELSGKVPVAKIAERFSMSRKTCHYIIKQQIFMRRAG